MTTTDHPLWKTYKAALEAVAQAGARLESAQQGGPDLAQAESEFRSAIEAYDAIRKAMGDPVWPSGKGP